MNFKIFHKGKRKVTDLNGLTNPFENSVMNQNLTQLEKEKQIRLYLEAVTQNGYIVPTDIIVNMNMLSATGVLSLSVISGFNQVLTEAFSVMTYQQFSSFTPASLQNLSSFEIAALPIEVFTDMTAELFTNISLNALGGVTGSQITQLAASVFASVTAEMLRALSPDALANVTADQIAEVLVDVFLVLTSDLLAALSGPALGGVTALQLAALPVAEFAALTDGQLAALSADALSGITAEQFATLDPAQLQMLQGAGLILAITSDGIEADGDTSAASFAIDENTSAITTVTATSPQAAALTYSLLGADADLFQIDNAGALAFKVAPDFEGPHGNSYNVEVQVSDGVQFDTQAITVNVTDVNDVAPRITSDGADISAVVSVEENQTVVTTVVSSDPDTVGAATYSITGGLDQALFKIDGLTGALAFKVAPDFETPQAFGGGNVYDVIVQVSDGVQSDSQAIAVTVTNDVSDDNVTAPDITSDGGGATASVAMLENETAVTTVTSFDPDPVGDAVYSIGGGLDAALFQIDNAGALSFIVAPDFETPQDVGGDNFYDVTVQVFDGVWSDTQDISVVILDDPNEPTLLPGVQAINAGPNLGFFDGIYGQADIFVFDASILSTQNPIIDINNFNILEDYLVFTNFEVNMDGFPRSYVPGQLFADGDVTGHNFVTFFDNLDIAVHQDREGGEVSDNIIQISDGFNIGSVDLRPSFGGNYSDSQEPVTSQANHVLFFADGFEYV